MFFIKSAKFFVLVSLTKGTFMSFVNKETPMFTNEIKDVREAASKPRKKGAKRPMNF